MRGPLVDALKHALANESGVELAIFFGSRALGRHRSDSDLDLALRAPGLDILSVAGDLSGKLGLDVHPVELEDAGYPLLRELVDRGVVVHEGRPGAAALWRSRALSTLETDGPWFARMRDAYLAKLSSRVGT